MRAATVDGLLHFGSVTFPGGGRVVAIVNCFGSWSQEVSNALLRLTGFILVCTVVPICWFGAL